MPTMKVTPDAAMRARDVSRPHPEHLEWAEEAEASVTVATDVVVEVDIRDSESPDSEYPGLEDRADRTEADRAEAEADRTEDGTRRRRVRGLRSSSRRGRPYR